ncbi:MAG: hypothetical protein KGL73_10355 [Burkholderiales bacterium]|nr:hypothetical protein [Burkholderiales bacterium]
MHETCSVLLLEPDYLLRRTVVAAARSLFDVDITETSRYENADALTRSHRYQGLILALDDDNDQVLTLVQKLRAGELLPAHDSPVALMCYEPDRRRAEIITALNVQRIIIKPLKVRLILGAMTTMAPARSPRARVA